MISKINPNQDLLKRIRESNVKGPFEVEAKVPGFLEGTGLDFGSLAFLLRMWEPAYEGKVKPTTKEVADYLEEYYLGLNERGHEYVWEPVNERIDLKGNKVLKIKSIPHPDSIAPRRSDPLLFLHDDYIWVRIKPSF